MRLIYAILAAITCVVAIQATQRPAEVYSQRPVVDYDIGPDSPTQVNLEATTLVVYSAEWCLPCQMMKPMLRQLKREGYKIVILDVDKIQRGEQEDKYKAKKTGVVPEIIWWEDGKVVKRDTGYQTRIKILKVLRLPDDRESRGELVDGSGDRLPPDNG